MGHDRILVVGATGYLGTFVAKASAELGHPTFGLIRPSTLADPAKAETLASLKEAGVRFLEGSLEDHHSLIEALKQVDVVISTVGGPVAQLKEQSKLVSAIQEVGHIKRFVPSDFGSDPNRSHKLPASEALFGAKIGIQEATKAAGIPYTFLFSNGFAGLFLPSLGQVGHKTPPKKAIIYGHAKAYCVAEKDIATYTVKAAVDPRAENKALYIRPAHNLFSHSEVVEVWEKKSGTHVEKIQLEGDDVLKKIEETPFPFNTIIALLYSVFVKGDQSNFEVPQDAVEATHLYPDVHYTTVDEFFDRFL